MKSARWDYRRILLDYSRVLQERGCEGLITGHFHLALHEKLPESGFTLLSLGDWMEKFTYGEMRDGNLQLMTYSAAAPTV